MRCPGGSAILFWLPVSHAYLVFCYAYSALFGIPDFTREALMRQPDRFSQKRLALTIRSTSGFVLDGFGYDRRYGSVSPRIFIGPVRVIRSVHVESARHNKARISNPGNGVFLDIISSGRRNGFLYIARMRIFSRQRQRHYDFGW